MKLDREQYRLYAVTDRTWLNGRTLEDVVELALKGGATLVQLREKDMEKDPNPDAFVAEALRIKKVCSRYHVPLIINDRVDVAKRSGADGVHLGQDDMPIRKARAVLGDEAVIGATAHNVAEAVKAAEDGADYLGCGAAFGSLTKKDAKPIDRGTYLEITSSVYIPVVAIGGIDITNIGQLQGAGLSGAAVVSGIFAQQDIEAAARDLLIAARKL